MLDVDLDSAQQILRLPPSEMPLPPIALPAVLDADGTVLADAVDAPDTAAPAAAAAPAPTVALRGAYARRAATG